MKNEAILIIAHGSKVKETNETMTLYMEALSIRKPDTRFEKCYLQLMDPDLRASVSTLYSEGYRTIKAFPFFLFKGNHIREDIPSELEKILVDFPDLTINFLGNIGFDEKLVELIIERVDTSCNI